MKIKFSKFDRWLYFDGTKFENVEFIADSENEKNYEVNKEKLIGKILFSASTTRQGKRAHYSIYLATLDGLIKFRDVRESDISQFLKYFTPHIISDDECDKLLDLLEEIKKIKSLVPYDVEIILPEATSDIFDDPLNYLARIIHLSTNGRRKSFKEIEKYLHQLFTLFKIISILRGEILTKQIQIKQRIGCGDKNIDMIMPVNWNGPQLKFKWQGEIYSIYHEFSVPFPIEKEKKLSKVRERMTLREIFSLLKKSSTKKFDIVIQKGDINSMFIEKPTYGDWNKYETPFDVPIYYFKKMKQIDILIECKEDKFDYWKSDIENQIIPYYEIYKPNKMALISRFSLPANVISYLERRGISVIAPFGFEQISYEQEEKLRNLFSA